jgi:UDP-N-acetylmuramate dehydrogenase
LAPFTTLRLGGPAASLVEVGTEEETVAAVREADAAGTPVLLLGGGSSIVIGDAGWAGVVVVARPPGRGPALARDGDDVTLTVGAGEPWDEVVRFAVAEGWAGLECLSGIPGLAGGAAVENVAAYGQQLADTATVVRALDRSTGTVLDLPAAACGFGNRSSRFQRSERYVVLAVTVRLRASARSAPITYAELAGALGLPLGAAAGVGDVRNAVLDLRRGSGRLVDPDDPDTWSVGSFFANPILSPAELSRFETRLRSDSTYPSWPTAGGTKLSPAWLVQGSGIGLGYGGARVQVSRWHPHVLVHRGGGTTAELLALAREIRDAVHDRFGVTLAVQPRLVGVTL